MVARFFKTLAQLPARQSRQQWKIPLFRASLLPTTMLLHVATRICAAGFSMPEKWPASSSMMNPCAALHSCGAMRAGSILRTHLASTRRAHASIRIAYVALKASDCPFAIEVMVPREGLYLPSIERPNIKSYRWGLLRARSRQARSIAHKSAMGSSVMGTRVKTAANRLNPSSATACRSSGTPPKCV